MTLLASIPPYWEAGRKIMYARMADPDTPAGQAMAGGTLAAVFRREDQDAADGGARRE